MVLANLGRSQSRRRKIFRVKFYIKKNWLIYLVILVTLPKETIEGLVLSYVFLVCLNLLDEVVFAMPIAVVVNDISDKMPLTTLPDGYVIVRRMNYGEKLLRSNLATKFLMSSDKGAKEIQGELDMQTEEVAYWDFANLIVEHNLEDIDNRALNFKNKQDVKKLAGPVGDEVGKIIDDFNAPENSEEIKNF